MRSIIIKLLLYLIAAVCIYFVNNQALKMVLLAGIIISSCRAKEVNQFLVFNGLAAVLTSFSSPILWIVPCIPLFVNTKALNSCLKYIKYSLPFFLIALLSYFFGQKSEINTMLVLFMTILIFIQVLDVRITPRELFLYSLFSLATIILILVLEDMRGGLELKFGRLNLGGSIRTVANIAAFPAFVSWSLLLQNEKSIKKYILILSGVVSSTLLLLTISKGAIIAVIVGVLVTAMLSKNNKSFFYLFVIVGILYYFFDRYIFVMADYHFFRLTEEFDGFTGRTDVWEMFLKNFSSSIVTILLGFGPGDIKRFAFADDTYAHSLYFDMILSYGVLMGLLFINVIIKLVDKIIKNRNAIAASLFIFTLLLYATHGAVTNSTFFTFLGVSYSLCYRLVVKPKQ